MKNYGTFEALSTKYKKEQESGDNNDNGSLTEIAYIFASAIPVFGTAAIIVNEVIKEQKKNENKTKKISNPEEQPLVFKNN
jgi:hypothetical protein